MALLAMAALLLSPATAAAHAVLIETIPEDGATVEGTPEDLLAVFDEAIGADGSSLSIRDAAGERLAVGRVDPDDPTRLGIHDVPELAPGAYEMRWTAMSADGDIERGSWRFTVAAAATPEPAAVPTVPPAPSPSATDPSGSSGGDAILPIVAGLAVVLIGTGYLLSRRGRPSDRV